MMITDEMTERAREVGVKLEMVGGIPVWEALPVLRHQKAVDRIRDSIRPAGQAESGCGCFHVYDLALRFPDGSQKRPDIAIFCREPEETDEEVTLLPEAVIEILSKGYEAKDLVIGVPFYLSQGVKDVVVFDPSTLKVLYFRGAERSEFDSPTTLTLACGCACTV